MKQVPFFIGAVFLVFNVKAQSKSTAAPSSALQAGYVYRLKPRYHILYQAYIKPPDSPAANNRLSASSLNLWYIDPKKINVKTHTAPIELDTIKRPPVRTLQHNITVGNPSGEIDTISRFYNYQSRRFSLWLWKYPPWKYFPNKRLRVAVNPADSGRLQISIYKRLTDTMKYKVGDSVPVNVTSVGFHRFLSKKNPQPGSTNYIQDDCAIALKDGDSVQNLYLQVHNKVYMYNPISFISLPYSMTQYGAFTVPFKYRFATKDSALIKNSAGNAVSSKVTSEASAGFNLALYVGRKWGHTRFYFDPTKATNSVSFMVAGFAGPALVPLSASNIGLSDSLNKSPSNLLAMSVGFAAVFEWHSINFGLFTGWDLPLTRNTGWVYAGKEWIGFGIGVNLGMFTSANAQAQF
jgi:hypothetical protein